MVVSITSLGEERSESFLSCIQWCGAVYSEKGFYTTAMVIVPVAENGKVNLLKINPPEFFSILGEQGARSHIEEHVFLNPFDVET